MGPTISKNAIENWEESYARKKHNRHEREQRVRNGGRHLQEDGEETPIPENTSEETPGDENPSPTEENPDPTEEENPVEEEPVEEPQFPAEI